jgi:hypothetical protein
MPPESSTPAYDRERWMRALESMARALGKDGQPVQLCLIGSAACIFAGMDLRVSEDLDIWQPSSDYDLTTIKKIISAFPKKKREIAGENLVYLEIFQ